MSQPCLHADVHADMALFARWQIDSGDIDPAYPVLRWLIEELALDDEQAISLCLLYVAYYHLPSALEVFHAARMRWPSDLTYEEARFPTGVERRGHRAPDKLHKHRASLTSRLDGHGSFRSWLWPPQGSSPASAWNHLQATLTGVTGNGRWAAYKMGEVLIRVLGYPAKPTDAGHAFSTGPRKGLELVEPEARRVTGNRPGDVQALNYLTEELRRQLEVRLGFPLPVEQLETVLCDFHSLYWGRYYVGRDWDEMLHQINVSDFLSGATRDILLAARRDCCPDPWRGEAKERGWSGVRRRLMPLYRQTGIIEHWEPVLGRLA